MASYETSDDSPPAPSETPRRRNASEIDVASRLTSPIYDGHSQAVVGVAMVNKTSALLDLPTFDYPTFDLPTFDYPIFHLPTFNFAKIDFSSALNSISMVHKTSALLDLPKFNYPTFDLPKFDFAKIDFSSALNSITMVHKTSALLDLPKFNYPTFDLPTFNFAKIDFSSALNSISMVHKTSALLDLLKVNYPSFDLPKFDLPKFDFATFDVSSALNSIDTQSLLGDPNFLEKLDELFNQLPEGEFLLAEASDDLIQFISFEHNETVRRILQVLIVAVFHTILAGAYMIPFVAGPLSAYGTPNAKQTWKATGAAYDRLYGIKDYHPDRALEKGTPSIPRSGPRRTTRR